MKKQGVSDSMSGAGHKAGLSSTDSAGSVVTKIVALAGTVHSIRLAEILEFRGTGPSRKFSPTLPH